MPAEGLVRRIGFRKIPWRQDNLENETEDYIRQSVVEKA